MTDTNANPTTLLGEDQVPTRRERELFEKARGTVERRGDGTMRTDDLVAEIVALGVPHARAQQILDAYREPGGVPPINDGKPTIDWLLRKHFLKLDPIEMMARIARYYPAITPDEISVEIKKYVAWIRADADHFDRMNEIFQAWRRQRGRGAVRAAN